MISKRLLAASYRPLVLSLLERGEMYGYQIIQRVRRLSDDQIRWTPGRLYPLLHQMESKGLVRARWDGSESGRERKYYAITPKGRKALENERREWLEVHSVLVNLWSVARPDLA